MLVFQTPLGSRQDRYDINFTESNNRLGSLEMGTILREAGLGLPKFLLFSGFALFVVSILPAPFLAGLGGFLSGSSNPIARLFSLIILVTIPIIYLIALVLALAAAYPTIIRIMFVSPNKADLATVWAVGAREPSFEEESKIVEVLNEIAHRMKEFDIEAPIAWWVLDSLAVQGFTIGHEIYLTSGALNSKHLSVIIAHEIAHLNNGDGAALQRLRTLPPKFMVTRMTTASGLSEGVLGHLGHIAGSYDEFVQSAAIQAKSFLWGFVFSGFSVVLMASKWAEYFRERDYLADNLVLQFGYGEELVKYLSEYKELDQAVPFSASWVQYSELRKDRVLMLLGQ